MKSTRGTQMVDAIHRVCKVTTAQKYRQGSFHRIFSSVGCEVYDIMNSVLKIIFLSPMLKHRGAVVTSPHFTDKTQLVLI